MAVNLQWICSVPLGTAISIFGLIGNFISIIVWREITRKHARRNISTGVYLITLGVIDASLLVFFLLADTIPTAWPTVKENYHFAAFFSWFAYPFFFFFVVASIWLVVGVTLNRFVMITFPTKVDMIYSGNKTYMGIVLILAFCFIVNVPHFFSFSPKLLLLNGTSEKWLLDTTEFGNSDGARHYDFWVHCIFLVLAPWSSIAILNSCIVYKLMKQTKRFANKGEKKDKKARQERQMTVMLLLVTFTFLILLAWQCIAQCFWMLKIGIVGSQKTDTWRLVDSSFAFAKLGIVINSSINCLFYCFSGSVFRHQLVSMISRRSSYVSESTLSSTPTSKVSSVEMQIDT